jgi:hypothetical protein
LKKELNDKLKLTWFFLFCERRKEKTLKNRKNFKAFSFDTEKQKRFFEN